MSPCLGEPGPPAGPRWWPHPVTGLGRENPNWARRTRDPPVAAATELSIDTKAIFGELWRGRGAEAGLSCCAVFLSVHKGSQRPSM